MPPRQVRCSDCGNLSIRQAYPATQERRRQIREQLSAGEDLARGWLQSLAVSQSCLSRHCHFKQRPDDRPELDTANIFRTYAGLGEDEFI